MAETIVNLVLGKLAEALIHEAILLYGVRDKVERVQRELTWIQSFLKDADKKRHKNERVKRWVHEVKEVGYLIEDTLDRFLMEANQETQDGALKKVGKLPMKLIAKHKLGMAIDKILKRIAEISANTTKYGIEGLKDDSTVEAASKQLVKPIVIPDLDETDVVGFEAEMATIADQLLDTNSTRRSVISIVGAGGSGKTTVAKELYKRFDIKSQFDVRLWVTVSEEYKLKDILIKMLESIGPVDLEMRQMGEEHLVRNIYDYLRERKYLVVLDDVWSENLWTQLHIALPEITNNSRVLITTRFKKVAEEADAISKPHEIEPLNEEQSQELLLKKIFPNQYVNKCPDDLLTLVPQFAKKCGGLPLALVVMGGILSRKIPDHNTWDKVVRNIDWHTDGNMCMGVISTSYDDLPIHLKTCFMYFAAFPEDYQIKATTLIKLWVAEGFVDHDTSKTKEDLAEDYLEELVQRCMVQVASRSIRGKIKYCYLHDLLREVAIQKAKEDSFLTVFSKNDMRVGGSIFARRVALHNCDNLALEQASAKLRSLFSFGDHNITSWTRFRMLRVLNIPPERQHNFFEPETRFSSRWLKDLTLLRYLESQDDAYTTYRFNLSHLTYIRYLQTVNISYWNNKDELPISFWENKLLRHVIFSTRHANDFLGPMGPPSSADLKNLLTLKWVTARQEWATKLPQFPNLRKLGLTIPENVDLKTIVNSINNLEDVESLSLNYIDESDDDENDEDEGDRPLLFPCGTMDFRNQQKLYSLSLLGGKWPKQEVVDCDSMVPPYLVKLKLNWYAFEEDPMPLLEKLPNLRVLELFGYLMRTTSEEYRRMICSSKGFTRLQRLVLFISLEELKIEDGAMPLLNHLNLGNCHYLKTVPDFQYLINLRELKLWDIRHSHCNFMRGVDRWKVKHIPTVRII